MARVFKEKIELYLQRIITDKKNGLGPAFIKVFLFLLSCVYRIILEIRFLCLKMGLIKPVQTAIKVISVGNITVGGTGKTPLVEIIVEKIFGDNKKTAVITRGYHKGATEVVCADEPQMLKEAFCELPVIVNSDRIAGIEYAVKHYASQCVVLDDAFQNLSLIKDLNIVCIDCNNPFGNGHLLPRGIIRLPFSYLSEADVFMLTSSEQGEKNITLIEKKLRFYNKHALICKANHVPQYFYDIHSEKKRELEYIQGKRIGVISGIASPERFVNTLRQMQAEIASTFIFPDHHDYSLDDIKTCVDACRERDIHQLITTAKDAVKLRRLIKNRQLDITLLILKVKLEIEENEERFNTILSNIYST